MKKKKKVKKISYAMMSREYDLIKYERDLYRIWLCELYDAHREYDRICMPIMEATRQSPI